MQSRRERVCRPYISPLLQWMTILNPSPPLLILTTRRMFLSRMTILVHLTLKCIIPAL